MRIKKQYPSQLEHDLAAEVLIDVRFSETDLMGVVYHANYFNWFDIARFKVLENMGGILEKKNEVEMPVVKVNCEYLKPARFGDQLIVRAVLEKDSVAKFTFHFTVKNKKNRRIIARATTVSVLNKKTGGLLLRRPDVSEQR
jgi:acyl-CoA thioester hydrolase